MNGILLKIKPCIWIDEVNIHHYECQSACLCEGVSTHFALCLRIEEKDEEDRLPNIEADGIMWGDVVTKSVDHRRNT